MNRLKREGVTLAASVSCFNLYNIESQMKEIEKAGVKLLHFDVVDGRFNDCFILGTPTLEAIRSHTKLPIEVHLGVMEPQKYISQFASAGADYIAVHYEAMENNKEALMIFDSIKKDGALPLLAMRAETDIDENLAALLCEVEWVIKLLVNPGYSGQKMKASALQKMKDINKEIIKMGLKTGIEADGNVNDATIPKIIEAGADILTGGSSGLFWESASIAQNAKKMMEAAKEVTT